MSDISVEVQPRAWARSMQRRLARAVEGRHIALVPLAAAVLAVLVLPASELKWAAIAFAFACAYLIEVIG